MSNLKRKHPRSATTRLEPGQHSVDRNQVRPGKVNGYEGYVLYWAVRLHNGQLIPDKRTFGTSKTAVKNKARATAEDLLRSNGNAGSWKPTQPIEAFIDEVCIPSMQRKMLAEGTIRRYTALLKLWRQELKGHTIASAMQTDPMLEALHQIGLKHGPENMRQAKAISRRYLQGPLRKRQLLQHDPLADERLPVSKYPLKQEGPRRGGQGLSVTDHYRVLDYLMAIDPEAGVVAPKRGRYTFETRVARNRSIRDLTIFQAGTGMRITEALAMTPKNIILDDKGQMRVAVQASATKTKTAREAPVLIPAVQSWIENMLEEIEDEDMYLFGAPADRSKKWRTDGNGGASEQAKLLYKRMAADLDIEALGHLRTHLWRTSLSTMCFDAGIPKSKYSAFLGHDEKTNEKSYTEGIDLTAATQSFRSMHKR